MKKTIAVALSVGVSMTMVGCNSTDKVAPKVNTVETVQQAKQLKFEEGLTAEKITGSVSYRERIALPNHAIIHVTLSDISLADAPAKTISQYEFKAEGKSSPFEYSLPFDAKDIQLNHRYAVRATISIDGKLRFTTDTNYSVITDAEHTFNQDLLLVGVRQ